MYLTSPALAAAGFVHGFSTRRGGLSAPPLASLNLGGSVGDDPAVVERNLQLLAAGAGIDRASFRTAIQVHGDAVLLANGGAHDPGSEADAILAATPGLAPAVKTADCVPILLADVATGRVAAVHAGWRGTASSIVARALEAMVEGGAQTGGIVAAIGPAIGRCCYEVSPALAASFVASHGPGVADGRHLDLPEVNRQILLRAGLPAAQIDMLRRCTSCDPDLFFSHRRDAGRTGRHLAFIVAGGGRSLS